MLYACFAAMGVETWGLGTAGEVEESWETALFCELGSPHTLFLSCYKAREVSRQRQATVARCVYALT